MKPPVDTVAKRPKKPVGRLAEGDVDPLSHAITERDQSVMDMVNEALAKKQGVIAFQPIVQAGNVGHIAFYEGLIRILDKTGRPIPAKDFMGDVEDTETGRLIDCLTLELSLVALAADPRLRLSVNMSARSIGYPRWMKTFTSGLSQRDQVGHRLILELTEPSVMAMPELVGAFMKDIQKTGVSFALDNFGSGTTKFRHLRGSFFDILKIDGQFSKNIARDIENQVIVETMRQLGQNLDMFTVATRVESAQDAAMLTALGVDCLQGFHIGAPKLKVPEASEQQDAKQSPMKQAG